MNGLSQANFEKHLLAAFFDKVCTLGAGQYLHLLTSGVSSMFSAGGQLIFTDGQNYLN